MSDGAVEGFRGGLPSPSAGDIPLRATAFTGAGDIGAGGPSALGGSSPGVSGVTGAVADSGVITGSGSWADALKDALSGLLTGRDVLEVVQEAGGVEEQVDPFLMLGIDHEEGHAP